MYGTTCTCCVTLPHPPSCCCTLSVHSFLQGWVKGKPSQGGTEAVLGQWCGCVYPSSRLLITVSLSVYVAGIFWTGWPLCRKCGYSQVTGGRRPAPTTSPNRRVRKAIVYEQVVRLPLKYTLIHITHVQVVVFDYMGFCTSFTPPSAVWECCNFVTISVLWKVFNINTSHLSFHFKKSTLIIYTHDVLIPLQSPLPHS